MTAATGTTTWVLLEGTPEAREARGAIGGTTATIEGSTMIIKAGTAARTIEVAEEAGATETRETVGSTRTRATHP